MQPLCTINLVVPGCCRLCKTNFQKMPQQTTACVTSLVHCNLGSLTINYRQYFSVGIDRRGSAFHILGDAAFWLLHRCPSGSQVQAYWMHACGRERAGTRARTSGRRCAGRGWWSAGSCRGWPRARRRPPPRPCRPASASPAAAETRGSPPPSSSAPTQKKTR